MRNLFNLMIPVIGVLVILQSAGGYFFGLRHDLEKDQCRRRRA